MEGRFYFYSSQRNYLGQNCIWKMISFWGFGQVVLVSFDDLYLFFS